MKSTVVSCKQITVKNFRNMTQLINELFLIFKYFLKICILLESRLDSSSEQFGLQFQFKFE